MSSITSSFGPRSKRSYLTMTDVANDIYTYTTSFNTQTRVTTGDLNEVGTSVPKGSFLYENGRKLYPGAHPGVNTYMVGVFDPVTFVTGYIDPNSKVFTPMNTDKPVDTAATETAAEGVFGTDPNTETSDLAQPIFTRGDILAEGNMDISGNAEIHQNLLVDLSGRIAGNFDVSGNLNVDGNLKVKGLLYLDSIDGISGYNAGDAICGTVALNGATDPADSSATILTTACSASSKIFITRVTLTTVGGGSAGNLIVTPGANSFVITSVASNGETSLINWLVINDASA